MCRMLMEYNAEQRGEYVLIDRHLTQSGVGKNTANEDVKEADMK